MNMIEPDNAEGLPPSAALATREASVGMTMPVDEVVAGYGHGQTSERVDQIADALSKAQGEFNNPKKGSLNPHFKSRYADLADGLNSVRAALSNNGIAIVQSTYMDGCLMLRTQLIHSSGQWVASEYPVIQFPAKPQEIGSAMTYARRYSLFPMVGIAGDDDDGNAATGTIEDQSRHELISSEQVAELHDLIGKIGKPDAEKNFMVYFKIENLGDLPARDFGRAVAAIKAKAPRS
mgnify:CR=1 FL=1